MSNETEELVIMSAPKTAYALFIEGEDAIKRPVGFEQCFVLVWDEIKVPWPEGKTAKQAFLDWLTSQREG